MSEEPSSQRVLRVLHVVDSLEPGGMENGIANVANALHGNGFEIHACCLRTRGRFAERMPAPELVRSLDKEPGFSLRWAHALRDTITEVRPDIVHSHNLGALIYTTGATRMGRLAPVIHGEHAEFAPAELVWRRLYLRRLLYRACRKVHTVSDSLTAHLGSVGMPMARVVTIRNGVDTERFSPETEPAELPFPSGTTTIGMVGRFGEFKGHRALVEAFEMASRERDDLRLLLVGDGGPRKEAVLAQIAASPLSDRIHWGGFQKEPAAFYRAMDLLVVPSTNEGLSNAVLEAMACGTPVLASDSCGCGEAIGDSPAGALCDMSSPSAIAAALKEHFSRAEARDLGAVARDHVVRHFSFDKMVSGYRQLYTSSKM